MLISCFIVLLLWHSAFMQQFNFTYTDEIITLLLGLYLIYAIITRNYNPLKYEKNILRFTILFYILGFCATIIHDFQKDISYGAISGVFSIKAFICFLGTCAYLQKKNITKSNLYKLLKIVEVPLLPISILLIIDQFVGLFPQGNVRFGEIKVSLFIFTHPTELAGFAVCSMLLVCFLRQILSLKKQYILNCFPAFIIVVISGRYKALGFIIFYICLDIILPFIKHFKLRYVIVGILPAYLISYNQIMVYFGDSTTARSILYKNGFSIAKDYFPLGSGFGTYGTEYSRAKYSIVYYMYNMEDTYGLSPRSPYFICDTMWPAIFGEVGILGFLAICGIIYNIIIAIKNSSINNKNIVFILYALVIYLLIESIAETIFMNPKGCLIFIMIAFMLSILNADKVEN